MAGSGLRARKLRSAGIIGSASVSGVCSIRERSRQTTVTDRRRADSLDGWVEVKQLRKREQKQFNEQRILGGEEFVKEILNEAELAEKERFEVAGLLGISVAAVNPIVVSRKLKV